MTNLKALKRQAEYLAKLHGHKLHPWHTLSPKVSAQAYCNSCGASVTVIYNSDKETFVVGAAVDVYCGGLVLVSGRQLRHVLEFMANKAISSELSNDVEGLSNKLFGEQK